MINLGLLRKEPEYIAQQIKKKDPNFNINKLIELDKKVLLLKSEIEKLRFNKNKLAVIGKRQSITQDIIEKSRSISKNLNIKEDLYRKTLKDFNDLYLYCPNVPEESIPTGGKESNKVIKVVGEKPKFNFAIKDHLELGKINNWFDFKAASLMSGHNFALYKGQAVSVIYSLMMYMLSNNINYGFQPYLPPYLVNKRSLINSGNLPKFKDDIYKIENENLYLIPTAEVSLTNIYQDQILSENDLSKRMTSWTSCFRKEAGTYGAQERGLIRLHQFEKAELYTVCTPDQADDEFNNMLESAQAILKKLNLHYRIVLLAAEDMSFSSAKTYDIEVWFPAQNEYKEVSSISLCTDFQSRRAAIRYRSKQNQKTKLAYTLNGSSLALPRLMVALMEAYQQEDGSIKLPDAIKSTL